MPVTINTVANYKVFRPVKTVRGTPPPPLTANLVVTTPPAGMSVHTAHSILAGHPCPCHMICMMPGGPGMTCALGQHNQAEAWPGVWHRFICSPSSSWCHSERAHALPTAQGPPALGLAGKDEQ